MNVLGAKAALTALGGSLGGGGNGMSAEMNYRLVQQNREQRFNAYVDSPKTQREIDYFGEKIAELESPDDVIQDYRLKKFILQSFGLEDLENSNYMLERILTDDLGSEDALAYRMNDPRFQDIAITLRLDQGIETIQTPDVVNKIVQRYLINGFEKEVGDDNVAARQAMYFKRNAGSMENIFQLMADPTLKEVARLGAGLPAEIARLDFDRQAELYEKNIQVEQLKDPKYVDDLINRFLIRSDLENGGGFNADSAMVGLFGNSSGLMNIVV
jgi:hypothetical protein